MSKLDSNQRFLAPRTFIKEGTRLRTDYGDIAELADSIKELGLLQPIVITLDGTLIAGGRRLRAMDSLKWDEIPVTYFEVADEVTLRILEVEENVRRKAMTWQERVMAIATVHQKQEIVKALHGDRWTQAATGELLGMSTANVNYAINLASYIRTGDKEILKCEKLTDALALLVKRAADESTKALAKLTLPPVDPAAARRLLEEAPLDNASIFSSVAATAGGVATLSDDGELPGQPTGDAIVIPLSKMCIRQPGNGSDISMVRQIADASVDHCITDWPYGNDMDNIQQAGGGQDVSSTAAEHKVDQVRSLHFTILPEIYRVLKDTGFFITFADLSIRPDELEHTLKVVQCATALGFKVQAWPLIWYKTSGGQNMAAGYNFTKDYEIVLVFRKEKATLITPQSSSVFPCGNDSETKAFGHPFAKPMKLWHWLFSAVAHKGQLVLDPFAGCGSSTLAAIQYGLQPLAIECNETHHARLVVNVSEHYKRTLKNVKFV